MIIIALFIALAIIATRSYYQSAQNKLWAAMARETAHQLGTPVSSLQGWLEILKEQEANASIVPEISKDVNRLLLITDRFGKIGSLPKLERSNPTEQIQHMLEYMKKRTGGHVQFEFNGAALAHANPLLSPPLFDWVLENLIKNALDAIEGNGKISIRSQVNDRKEMILDITDTGKGIPKNNLNKVFKPGFTTKKRGWGLGLPLCKRIIEEYHKGRLFVKSSEPGKGTTFRIVLPA